ncbi:hypothetical protein TRVL_06594 [Trypanosoma vivax]|nr:hypothetical protein TRVL_06594 [Trypanosoma vivax]
MHSFLLLAKPHYAHFPVVSYLRVLLPHPSHLVLQLHRKHPVLCTSPPLLGLFVFLSAPLSFPLLSWLPPRLGTKQKPLCSLQKKPTAFLHSRTVLYQIFVKSHCALCLRAVKRRLSLSFLVVLFPCPHFRFTPLPVFTRHTSFLYTLPSPSLSLRLRVEMP